MLLAWAATAFFSYRDARVEIGRMLDAHLEQVAAMLTAELAHEIAEHGQPYIAREVSHDLPIVWQVWEDGRVLRVRSTGAPDTRLSSKDDGLADVESGGVRWRVMSRWDDARRHLVQVAERYTHREELSRSVASHIMHPLVIAVPVLGALIWLGVSSGLAPLASLAQQVAQRTSERLGRIDPSDAPREVLPLVAALNGLLGRLGASLERERRFTADAAHELRTPLAALKTQAQVALGARDGAERDRALAEVVAGVDRSAHLVEQLLVLARLDPGAGGARRREHVPLRALAERVVAELAPAALGKRIELAVEGCERAQVIGDSALLRVLLRNLVDNAIRYTPAGGAVTVRVDAEDHGARLRVSDTGPGIAAEERERVFDRFYRGLGTGESGSGLGLSIASRVADLHGAEVALASGVGGGGLVVDVRFPATESH